MGDTHSNEAIEKVALSVLVGAGIPAEPPVDLICVADSLGVRIYRVLFADPEVSGMVSLDSRLNPEGTVPGERATVLVNAAHPATRQNFTAAHELGHLELEHIRPEDGFRADRYRALGQPYDPREEREANRFAAALLMPAKAFGEAMYRQKDIARVALTFSVSTQAATYRALDLGLNVPW